MAYFIALPLSTKYCYGRVMSITMLAFSGTGLVALPIGLLADAIGERGTLMAMGAGVCLVVALLAVWSARAGTVRPAIRNASPVSENRAR